MTIVVRRYICITCAQVGTVLLIRSIDTDRHTDAATNARAYTHILECPLSTSIIIARHSRMENVDFV